MSGKTTFPDRNDRAGHGRMLPVLAVLLVLASPMAMAANGGGSLTETISGYVFDETGIPAEGVLVNVEHTSVGAPTDSKGHYFLRGVDLDGQGTLVFTADGYLTVRVEYDLTDGGRMSRSLYLVEVEEEAGEVVGTVTAFDGSPVEGALLTMTGNGLPSTSVRTGPEGNFRFRDLSPEEVDYTLTVEAEGHMTIDVTALVEAGAETLLDIVLLPEVPMELVRGSVTDGRGFPLPGATIALEGSRDEWTTDIDGTFSALVDEQKRTRDVTVSLNGYKDRTYPVIIPESGVATVHL
ncbi:MAG: carboxypeptidase regulatory-like domain-containing protein, partial [Thermoplasmata archaeon]|nr:carboxypeptidase regulatory-like domain-containing protein [Thermoplasmata archaeon]